MNRHESPSGLSSRSAQRRRSMHSQFLRKILLVELIVLAGMLCRASASPAVTIGEIVAQPEAYKGKSVTVTGQVSVTLPAGSESGYYLTDGPALITVVSRESAPQTGTRLQVTGKVRFFSEGDDPESNKF